MKQDTFTLCFLTPCFCAGADQARAEVRATAIRGQLRWWFRALGGTRDEETQIFGGLGDGDPAASRVAVRVSDIKRAPDWTPPSVSPNNPASYVWYFASVSGKAPNSGRDVKGPRWTPAGALPAGTTFKLHIFFRRELPAPLVAKFDNALKAFLALGGIGLRVTRGLGAFTCAEFPFAANEQCIRQILATGGFQFEKRSEKFPSFESAIKEIGTLLKGTRKAQRWKINSQNGVEIPSPFGASAPRQTSAIYFRPVSAGATKELLLIVFEAPHERVLGPESRKESIIGIAPSKLVHAIAPVRQYY